MGNETGDEWTQPEGHFVLAHILLGKCSQCPGVSVAVEMELWRELAREWARTDNIRRFLENGEE